jgi:hypothetical protein
MRPRRSTHGYIPSPVGANDNHALLNRTARRAKP